MDGWMDGRNDKYKSNLDACRLVGNETDALNLTNIVESNDADESTWVSLPTLLELLQHL